jgi:hypothetical protein
MSAAKMSAGAIVLGNGKIRWKLGKLCLVHRRPLATSNEKVLSYRWRGEPPQDRAWFGLLFSTTFINFKKLKKGAQIRTMRKATRLLIFFEFFRCVIFPTTLRHKLIPNKYLFLI